MRYLIYQVIETDIDPHYGDTSSDAVSIAGEGGSGDWKRLRLGDESGSITIDPEAAPFDGEMIKDKIVRAS